MKKSERKAQITLFVIIGIIVLVAGGIVTFVSLNGNNNIKEYLNKRSVSSEVGPVYDSLNNCFKQRAIDAIRLVGLQGGYAVTIPNESMITSVGSVAYGYYLGKNTLPSKIFIENEINSYLESGVFICLMQNNVSMVSIYPEDRSIKTKLNRNNIGFSIRLPIAIVQGINTYELDQPHEFSIPFKLGDMIDKANNIVLKEQTNNGQIPVGYFSELDYDVLILSQTETEIAYAIVDMSNQSKIDDIEYSFIFANKFKEIVA